MPSLPSCSASRLAPCLVLVKTSTCCQPVASRSGTTGGARLRSFATRWTVCVTSSIGVLRGATSTSAGSCSMPLASVRISSENVAEKSRFWRLAGSSLITRRMSGMKPMSSMRSASSSTKISTRGKVDGALRHVVEQPARRGHQDVQRRAQGLDLRVDVDAAEDDQRRGCGCACRISRPTRPPARSVRGWGSGSGSAAGRPCGWPAACSAGAGGWEG